MKVRPAHTGDIPAIQAIYAPHVLNGVGTFEEEPPSADEMARRLHAVHEQGLPWLVAEDYHGVVLGYAYAGPFRTRAAYRFTLEDSIYVSPGAQRQGVGRALLMNLVKACEAWGCRQLLALIGGSDNHGSIRLHAGLGFVPSGVLRDVGFKAGHWVDVVVMQKALKAER
jgi:L-amino acid N-acyltransferase YncA